MRRKPQETQRGPRCRYHRGPQEGRDREDRRDPSFASYPDLRFVRYGNRNGIAHAAEGGAAITLCKVDMTTTAERLADGSFRIRPTNAGEWKGARSLDCLSCLDLTRARIAETVAAEGIAAD